MLMMRLWAVSLLMMMWMLYDDVVDLVDVAAVGGVDVDADIVFALDVDDVDDMTFMMMMLMMNVGVG